MIRPSVVTTRQKNTKRIWGNVGQTNREREAQERSYSRALDHVSVHWTSGGSGCDTGVYVEKGLRAGENTRVN